MWSPLPLGAMWYSQNKRRNRDSSVCGTGLLSLSSVYAPYSGALLYSDQSWTTLSLCQLQRAQKILTNTFGTHCCVFQSSGSLEFLSRSICPFNRQHKFPKQVNLPACCLSRVSFLFFFFFLLFCLTSCELCGGYYGLYLCWSCECNQQGGSNFFFCVYIVRNGPACQTSCISWVDIIVPLCVSECLPLWPWGFWAFPRPLMHFNDRCTWSDVLMLQMSVIKLNMPLSVHF